MKKGIDAPAAIADMVPMIIRNLSKPSENLKRPKSETGFTAFFF
jgi:hypothetical protein